MRAAALGTATLMMITACGGDGVAEGAEDAELGLVTGVYPLEWLAARVGGDRVAVAQLTEPGAEPHDLELTGRQIGEVSEADIAFYVSGLQPAVDEAVEQEAAEAALDVADVVELHAVGDDGGHDHEGEEVHAHEEQGGEAHSEDEHAHEGEGGESRSEEEGHAGGDGHDHGDLDPHFWLDVGLMAEAAHALADRMAELDPDGAQTYEGNAAAVTDELETIGQEYDAGLAECARREVVVDHTAFAYLTEAHGLEQIGVSGVDPETEPSPSQIAAITDTVAERGVTTVFTEPLMPAATAQTIAAETGAEVAVLDPLEGVTDRSPGDDYPSIMRGNLAALTTALDCG
ncbi:ABC transporter substrate-binding protein [Nocardiopsis sp. CNR-923]|nr:ABC transporter substrate-binding protein [Nocardiopsis sp. CNR-923]